MATPTTLVDEKNGCVARVTKSGSLAVSPIEPSDVFNATLEVDDTPVEIVPSVGGSVFCITGIVLTGNKNISATVDATVTIYEATHDDTSTALRNILIVPVARSGQVILTNILLETSEGRVVMGKTTDDDVLVNIFGFYL